MSAQAQGTQAQEDKGTPFNLETCTADEFRLEVQNNASLAAEYLSNDNADKFKRINSLLDPDISSGTPVAVGTPVGTTTPAQGQPQADPDELTVTLKVKKDQLGSYLKNRSPEEAILAKMRGKDEADRYIENLKSTVNKTTNQTMTLQQQLREANEKLAQATTQASKTAAPAPALPKVEDLKNVDLFEVEGQKKVLDALGALTEAVTNRPVQEAVSVQNPTDAQAGKKDLVLEQQKLFEQNDMQQIYELQYQFPELSTSRDIFAIDADVAKAYNAMDQLVGGQGGVALYLSNTPQGEAFRERCSQAKISLPDEYDTWYQIMSAREERLNLLDRTAKELSKVRGQEFSIYDVATAPNTSLVDLFSKNRVESPRSRLNDILEQHRQERTATELPAGTVPEIPPSILNSQQPNDVSLWPQAKIDEFINSKPLTGFTRDEAVLVKAIYEMGGVPVPDVIKMKLK